MNRFAALAIAFAAASGGGWAQQAAGGGHDAHHAASAMAEGEVRKVDKAAGKVTLRHGPIASLDMPPMTMVFQAADPKLLDAVKAGDKVRFEAAHEGGVYLVKAIEPLR